MKTKGNHFAHETKMLGIPKDKYYLLSEYYKYGYQTFCVKSDALQHSNDAKYRRDQSDTLNWKGPF